MVSPLCLAVLLACSQLGIDLDQIVALEVFLPDSGIITVGDTLQPRGRALNGRGDSVAAEISWSSLDTAVIAVVDTATGRAYGKAAGTGRLQARVETLRSNPLPVIVREPPAPAPHLSVPRPSGEISPTDPSP